MQLRVSNSGGRVNDGWSNAYSAYSAAASAKTREPGSSGIETSAHRALHNRRGWQSRGARTGRGAASALSRSVACETARYPIHLPRYMMPAIRLATTDQERDACEALLRALPDWFGLPDAILQYRRDLETLDTWLVADDELLGFLAVRRHFSFSAELQVMAVSPHAHRRGLGRQLIDHAEARLRADGVTVWQVKTLSPSRESAAYACTRRFYEAMGFVALEEFPTLWDEANPCLQLVKAL